MSYINSDLLIPAWKLQTPGWLQFTTWINRFGLEACSQQSEERDQFKPNQEHIATHIFSNLVTHVPFFTIARLYKLIASF